MALTFWFRSACGQAAMSCGVDNGDAFRRVDGLTLAAPVSRTWKGYWER